MNAQHTTGATIYVDPKAPHQELTAEQRAILEAVPMLRALRPGPTCTASPGPWEVVRQPGGGCIANRLNFASPGNVDRLPKEGEFRTEGEARAAIARATP